MFVVILLFFSRMKGQERRELHELGMSSQGGVEDPFYDLSEIITVTAHGEIYFTSLTPSSQIVNAPFIYVTLGKCSIDRR